MAHPFNAHRQHHVEKERAHKIAGGRLSYASGGAVEKHASAFGEEDSEKTTDGQVAKDAKHRHLTASAHVRKHGGKAEGHKAKHRLDRRHRAKGGKAYTEGSEKHALKLIKGLEKHEKDEIDYERKHRATGGRNKKATTVNVVINPGGGDKGLGGAAMPPPMPTPAPAVMAPPMPPPGPPPGGPPGLAGGPPGALPPGLGPRPGMPMPPVRARGGGVRGQGPGDKMPEQPPGWRESEKHKTPVQHTDGKTDGKDIGRGPVITKARGGSILGDGKPVPAPPAARMKGGIGSGEQKPTTRKPPHLTAGAGGGRGRLEKAKAERRAYP